MFQLNQIPNMLTLLRIVLIVPFAIFVFRQQYSEALIVFFIAGVSDGVDGFLARQFNWKSRFGAIVDPLADKLLLMTAYITLALTEQLPPWLAILILSRDLVIVVGALIYHYRIGPYDIRPSILGKTCTMTQIVYVLAVIIFLAGLPMPQEVIPAGLWFVAAVTLLSGLHYVMVWALKGRDALNEERPSS